MSPVEERPEEGEGYDTDYEGKAVRLKDGRTGVVICRACSCYNPYEVRMDDTGNRHSLSCIDFTVIN